MARVCYHMGASEPCKAGSACPYAESYWRGRALAAEAILAQIRAQVHLYLPESAGVETFVKSAALREIDALIPQGEFRGGDDVVGYPNISTAGFRVKTGQ